MDMRKKSLPEGTSAKTLRLDHAFCVQGIVRRPVRLDWKEQREAEARVVTGARPCRAL